VNDVMFSKNTFSDATCVPCNEGCPGMPVGFRLGGRAHTVACDHAYDDVCGDAFTGCAQLATASATDYTRQSCCPWPSPVLTASDALSLDLHGTVLIYGGKGALGSGCVTFFKAKGWVCHQPALPFCCWW